jgi:hypothetical protein
VRLGRLTIVGGVREAWSVWRRARLGTVCARGAHPAWVHGPSTSPLGAMAQRTATPVATCHCGAIRLHVRQLPRTVTSCNCSICRRYGALWAYYKPTSVRIEAPKHGLSKYSWNQRIRDYHRCKRCGCVTHYTYRGRQRNRTIGVNAANFAPSALVGVRIRHLDGAGSWKLLD